MLEVYLSCFRASNGLTAIRLLASPAHYSSTRARKGAAVAARECRLLQHGLGVGGDYRAGGTAVIAMFGGWSWTDIAMGVCPRVAFGLFGTETEKK